MKPVLIVGAGLSAADAVTICRSSGINVIHVYRNRSAGLDKMLPETVYPEYHEVSAAVSKPSPASPASAAPDLPRLTFASLCRCTK